MSAPGLNLGIMHRSTGRTRNGEVVTCEFERRHVEQDQVGLSGAVRPSPIGPSRRAPEPLSLVAARGLIKRDAAPPAIYALVQPLRKLLRTITSIANEAVGSTMQRAPTGDGR